MVEEKNISKLKINKMIKMIIAEFIGTACLIFFGCMGCIDWIQMPGLPISAALNFGLTVMFVIQMIGHISFAIINPAVVVAAVVHKLISIKLAVFFIISEVAGAVFGYGVLKLLTPNQHMTGLCMTSPHPSITTAQAFVLEFFLTFGLVFVVSGAWDPKNKGNSDSVSIRIGLTVAALSFAGGTATGTSMNPARTLGPAFWNNDWTAHWIYWIAPMTAGFVSSKFYREIFWEEEESEGGKELNFKVQAKRFDDDKIDLTLTIKLTNDGLNDIKINEKCDENELKLMQ